MSNPTIKDSGERRNFDTGAVRDTDDGKPRPDLICPYFRLRLGYQLAGGLIKYGENNWTKGMPQRVYLASLHRHLDCYERGDVDEDHLAGLAFNVMALVSQDERIKRGLLPADLDNVHDWMTDQKGTQKDTNGQQTDKWAGEDVGPTAKEEPTDGNFTD